jgi:hypothetical protein
LTVNLANPIPGWPAITVSKTVTLPIAAMVNAPNQVNKASIGVAFEYITMESSKVPSELFSGGYNKPKMYFLTVNYSHRF